MTEALRVLHFSAFIHLEMTLGKALMMNTNNVCAHPS